MASLLLANFANRSNIQPGARTTSDVNMDSSLSSCTPRSLLLSVDRSLQALAWKLSRAHYLQLTFTRRGTPPRWLEKLRRAASCRDHFRERESNRIGKINRSVILAPRAGTKPKLEEGSRCYSRAGKINVGAISGSGMSFECARTSARRKNRTVTHGNGDARGTRSTTKERAILAIKQLLNSLSRSSRSTIWHLGASVTARSAIVIRHGERIAEMAAPHASHRKMPTRIVPCQRPPQRSNLLPPSSDKCNPLRGYTEDVLAARLRERCAVITRLCRRTLNRAFFNGNSSQASSPVNGAIITIITLTSGTENGKPA